jgi:hypothetical protein
VSWRRWRCDGQQPHTAAQCRGCGTARHKQHTHTHTAGTARTTHTHTHAHTHTHTHAHTHVTHTSRTQATAKVAHVTHTHTHTHARTRHEVLHRALRVVESSPHRTHDVLLRLGTHTRHTHVTRTSDTRKPWLRTTRRDAASVCTAHELVCTVCATAHELRCAP